MKANVLIVMALLGLSASAKMTEVSLKGATAYAETSIDTDRLPAKAIDGAGLTPVAGYGWTHSATRANQWHGKNSGNSDSKNFATWYLVDFGSVKTFDVIRIWNAQEFSCRGVKNVEFYVLDFTRFLSGGFHETPDNIGRDAL